MRITDLYADLFEATSSTDIIRSEYTGKNMTGGLPPSFQHSMPNTHSFPDMDNAYGFYRFVIAMAGHPEITDTPLDSFTRDIPIAIAYTPEEHDMIHSVAKRMGVKPTELAYNKSREMPDVNTKSPVMKFHMPESQTKKLRGLIKLSEAMTHAPD